MGDPFRVLFEEHFDYVYRSLRRLGVSERDLEDVTHDVFLEVHKAIARFDPARPPKPWLFAFAFRCASAYRRSAPHRFETLSDEGADAEHHHRDPAPGVDDALGARALLAKGLAHLDENKRAALILHELEGWPVAEIAHALQEPVQTIYSRLRSGREELTAALRRLGLQEGRRSVS